MIGMSCPMPEASPMTTEGWPTVLVPYAVVKPSPYSKRMVMVLTPTQLGALTPILRDALQQANDTLGFIQSHAKVNIDSSTRAEGQKAKELIKQLQPILDAMESI